MLDTTAAKARGTSLQTHAETEPSPPEKASRECEHCRLPLTTAQQDRGERFCCNGCRNVYALLHESGLERFYDLRRGPGNPIVSLRSNNFSWLQALEAEPVPSGPRRITLDIQGIHCAGCVWLLQALFDRQPGAVDLRINPALGQAEIVYDPAGGDLRAWLVQAEKFGYRFGPARKKTASRPRSLLIRMGISFAAAMNVMIFSLCYYFGLAPSDGALYPLFGFLSFLLATVSFLAGGSVFLTAAVRGLRHGLVHLDLPIGAGILLAYAGSTVAYFTRGPEAAYFDSVTLFIALMLVGRWVQERVLQRNRQALLEDSGAENLFTRRFRENRVQSIPVREVEAEDELWVAPGDLAPVQGTLLDSSGVLRTDWIHGESEPVSIEAGDAIPAGAFNTGDQVLRMKTAEAYEDSRLEDLLRSTATSSSRSEGQGFWARISGIYVAAVFLCAAAGFGLWAFRDMERAVGVMVSILIVACPCALGLAIPLARELVHVSLRRRGVFLRDGGFLDRALDVRKVIFDKTGTLTHGDLVLSPESREQVSRLPDREREVLYNLAVRSNHPASRAVARALATQELSVHRDWQIHEEAGRGLSFRLESGEYRLGRRSFARGESTDGSGKTVLSRNGTVIVELGFAETMKEDAAEEVRNLQESGLEVHLLSGDRRARVREVAARLHIPDDRVQAELDPTGKAARLREIDCRDTLMVGDGLNDGPSFDSALCSATPAVDHPSLPARADFYFLGEGIGAVSRALAAARKFRKVVRANLLLALLYNVAALTLCFLGFVTPVVAAVIMPLSSVALVSLTTYRLTGRRMTWTS